MVRVPGGGDGESFQLGSFSGRICTQSYVKEIVRFGFPAAGVFLGVTIDPEEFHVYVGVRLAIVRFVPTRFALSRARSAPGELRTIRALRTSFFLAF